MDAASEKTQASFSSDPEEALSFVEDCYRHDKGGVLQSKFDELQRLGLFEDEEEWSEHPLFRAMVLMESDRFPADLKVQGYRGWLDYWCRTDVPLDYRGEMLQRSLEPRLDHWPVPSLWQQVYGEHPLLSGYNLLALKLILDSGCYRPEANDLTVHRLYEHWDWGLTHHKVSQTTYEKAMDVVAPWSVRPKKERVLPKGWRKEVVLNTPGYFQTKLGSFLAQHAHIEFDYKGYRLTPVLYVIHKMLREEKTHYAHGLHHLNLSKGCWDKVKEHRLCDGLKGQDLLNFFDYLPMGQLGWATEKASFEEDQLEKKEEVFSLFEKVLEHRQFEDLFNFVDDYWFKSVWMNPLINTKQDVLHPDDIRRSLRLLCFLYESQLVKASNHEELTQNHLWAFVCDKHSFLEKMFDMAHQKVEKGHQEWRRPLGDIYQYLEMKDARVWYSSGVAKKLWREFIEKVDRYAESHKADCLEPHDYWIGVWKERLGHRPTLKGGPVLNPSWLKEIEGMELREELRLNVKSVSKPKLSSGFGSRF